MPEGTGTLSRNCHPEACAVRRLKDLCTWPAASTLTASYTGPFDFAQGRLFGGHKTPPQDDNLVGADGAECEAGFGLVPTQPG